MKLSELRECSVEELNSKIVGWQEELFRVRFAAQTSEKKDTSLKGKVKKNIARAATIIQEKSAAKN